MLNGDIRFIGIQNGFKTLHESRQDVAGFGQGELLAEADPGTAVEGQILPAGLPSDPSVGFEFVGVFSPQIFASVHGKHGVANADALGDEEGGLAVRTTAKRESSVPGGLAGVNRDGREEPEGFVQGVLEVGAALQGVEGDVAWVVVGAKSVKDDGPQFPVDVGVARETVAGPSHQPRRGVSSGEQDVEELAAEFDGVLGGFDELVEEDIALLPFLVLPMVAAIPILFQRAVNEGIGELMYQLAVVLEFLGVV